MEAITPEIIPSEEAVNDNLVSLQESMSNLDATTSMTRSARNQLMTKLLPTVLNLDMEVTDRTDPELYESKARLVSEMRGLLNDMDSSARNHTNMKLKHKDAETNATNALNVAEFMAKIRPTPELLRSLNQSAQNDQDIDAQLEKRFEEANLTILDTELMTGQTQLPEPRATDDV